MDSQKLYTNFGYIRNAYILYSLYKNEFIKSKPIILSANIHDIVHKIMHIAKTKIKEVFERHEDIYNSVSFSRTNLIIHLNCDHSLYDNNVKSRMLKGFSRYLYYTLNEELKNRFNISFSYDLRCYTISLKNIYAYSGNNLMTSREENDNLVNFIMYIPTLVSLIAEYINTYLVGIEDRVPTLFDMCMLDLEYSTLPENIQFDKNIAEATIIEGIETFDRFVSNNDAFRSYVNGQNEYDDLLRRLFGIPNGEIEQNEN